MLYLAHYPKVMLEQLKERLDLNSHTACTVTFQFTEPVHNIASLKAITNMDPRDVRSGRCRYLASDELVSSCYVVKWLITQAEWVGLNG